MIGQTLGHYEVTDKLGQGGMGSVWLAQDAKLGRQVAIKTLPEEFAQDEERLARFEREAKLLASLNHPNIATIHGLEEHSGTRFLVLELVEGDTLADRLKRGAIPVEDSLRLALQIAEALEAAHEKGVIHRDLKPANIKVTPDGKIKVLDFGLAKAFAGDGADVNLSQSPTLSMQATQQGVILGTAAYMSPEQARGVTVDKRADIWAFGCVLYEMLTGRQVFKGELMSDVMASVLKSDPDYQGLPPAINPRLRELLRRCLEKDTKQRWHDIGDVRVEAEHILANPVAVSAETLETVQPGTSRVVPWAAATLLVAILTGLTVWTLVPDSESKVVRRLAVPVSMSTPLVGARNGNNVLISQDGTVLVYALVTEDGDRQLFRRRMDEDQAVAIEGTRGATHPFLSPDDSQVGFNNGQRLWRVSISGGQRVSIAEIGGLPAGATWLPDDTIVYGDNAGHLSRVSVSGGTPFPITTLEDGRRHQWPEPLPDNEGLLFTVSGERGISDARIAVLSLGTSEWSYVEGISGHNARYMPSGHLVFMKESTLFAASFDVERLEVTGTPVPVSANVSANPAGGAVSMDTSDDGTMVFVPGSVQVTETVLLATRDGATTPMNVPAKIYRSPRVSPNGRRLAVLAAEDNGDRAIWVYDLLGSSTSVRKLTVDGNPSHPVWTPDGQRVTFASDRDGPTSIYWQLADGGPAERLTTAEEGTAHLPGSWSPDGRALSFTTNGAIWTLSLDTATPEPFYDSGAYESGPAFSPDGKWLAYHSFDEVYVQPFPATGAIYQVTQAGGQYPVWSRDGGELFYQLPGLGVLSLRGVNVDYTETAIAFGSEQSFEIQGRRSALNPNYDIMPDGERFVIVAPASRTNAAPTVQQVRVVLNWFQELKERVPVN